jgi:hypothetical protein
MAVPLTAALGNAVDDLLQPTSQGVGRVGRGLLDVQAPKMVQPVGDINAHARKLCQLFLPHQSVPGSPADQPKISIYVATLEQRYDLMLASERKGPNRETTPNHQEIILSFRQRQLKIAFRLEEHRALAHPA